MEEAIVLLEQDEGLAVMFASLFEPRLLVAGPTPPLLLEAGTGMSSGEPRDAVTIIVQVVASYYGVQASDLISTDRRWGWITRARRIAIQIARSECKLELAKVAQRFGICNCSSVWTMCDQMKKGLQVDERLRREYEAVLAEVNARLHGAD